MQPCNETHQVSAMLAATQALHRSDRQQLAQQTLGAGVAEVWDLAASTLQPVARHILPEAVELLKEGTEARPSTKAAAARATFACLAFSQARLALQGAP